MSNSGPGKVAMIGAGEFLPTINSLDQSLIDGLSDAPHVAILATASAPDGVPTFERWLRMGVEHYGRLGATVEPVHLATRDDAEDPTIVAQIKRANFVYLSGGKPRYLLETLRETPAWRAIVAIHAQGGAVAGCSAGGMVLASRMFDFPDRIRTIGALGLAPGVLVVPHFGEFPVDLTGIVSRIPPGVTVAGVERDTALVWNGTAWTVLGSGGVTVIDGRANARFCSGQKVAIPRSSS